ncbi:MAG: enhanced intracellular survival protein Eis [Candidatus Thorarchaeota archaeon]
MYDVREAKEEDRDSAIRLIWKAHDVTRNIEETKKERFAQIWHTPENRDWSFVATAGKEVVANVSFFEDTSNIIRGKTVPFSAVWGVATLPQHRRKGLIRKLFIESFKSMKEKGISLSILAPFYKGYYEKFGYSLAENRVRHEFPRILLRIVKGNSDITNRELFDVSESKITQQVQTTMARFGSRNFHLISTHERMIKEGHYHLFEKNDEPVGIVKFNFRKVQDNVQDLDVYATGYATDDIFPSIVELVGYYATNATTIRWYCDPQVPVRYYMDDLQHWNTVNWSGMMMRIVDIEEYCSKISVPNNASEQVSIQLKDDLCPWNEGSFKLIPTDGFLEIERLPDNAKAELTLDPLQLSEVIGGLTPASLLRNLDKLDCSSDSARKLEAIFPADSFVSYQRF